MAVYGEKYYNVYQECPMSELGLDPWMFKMSFSVLGYTGASTELEMYAENTCIIELVNTDAGIYDPLAPTKATFRFRVHDEATALSLYVADDRDVMMELYYDPTGLGTTWRRLWTGWGLPADLKLRYGTFPTVVEMSATDGLATLKDRPLLDSAGKRLTANNNLITLSRALRTALSQVGYEVPVTTGLNLFELGDMATGQLVNGFPNLAKDPLYQTSVLSESLVTEQNTTISSYDLLKKFEAFGMRIGQACGSESEGDWYAIRTPDAVGGNDPAGTADTIRTRRYNNTDYASMPNVGTGISRSMVVDVGVDKAIRVKKNTPSTGLTITKNAVRIEQTFGQMLSTIPNGGFSLVDDQNFPLQWKRNNLSRSFREGTDTDVDPYRLTLYGNGDEKFNGNTPMAYVIIPFNPLSPDYSKPIERTFECDFTCEGIRAAKIAVVADVENDKGALVAYVLEDGGSWTDKINKTNKGILTYHYYTDTDGNQKSKPGKASIKISMSGLAKVRQLRIYLCVGESLDERYLFHPVIGPPYYKIRPYDSPGNHVSYFNLRLSEADPGLNLTGIQYTVAKPNRIAETIASFTWGDVPDAVKPFSRTGSLFRTDTATPTSGRWFRAVETFPTQQGLSLLQLVGNDRAKQAMLPAPTFEGTLVGRLPYGLFTIIRLDDVVDRNGDLIKSALTRWRWNTRKCEHDITAHRAMSDKLILGVTLTKEWQSQDGVIPITTDTAGLTLAPSAIKPVVDNAPVSTVPELPGYSQADPAGPIIGADIYEGSVRIGRVLSIYQEQEVLPQ